MIPESGPCRHLLFFPGNQKKAIYDMLIMEIGAQPGNLAVCCSVLGWEGFAYEH